MHQVQLRTVPAPGIPAQGPAAAAQVRLGLGLGPSHLIQRPAGQAHHVERIKAHLRLRTVPAAPGWKGWDMSMLTALITSAVPPCACRSCATAAKLAALRPGVANSIRRERALHEQLGKVLITRIFVTHRPDAVKLADRILHLKDGRLVGIQRSDALDTPAAMQIMGSEYANE